VHGVPLDQEGQRARAQGSVNERLLALAHFEAALGPGRVAKLRLPALAILNLRVSVNRIGNASVSNSARLTGRYYTYPPP
jgi:hypothetical protein